MCSAVSNGVLDPPGVKAFSCPPAQHPAGHLLEQHAERRAHAGARSCPGRSTLPLIVNIFVPGRLLGAERAEPVRPSHDDVGHVHQGLDVVDHGRRGVQPFHRRERRAQARLTAQALQRVQQRGLFAADVGAGPAVQHDVQVVVAAGDAAAQVPTGVGLVERLLQHDRLPQVLAADVDERGVASDRLGRDRRALDQPVGLAFAELAVVAGARFGLVEVDRDVGGLAGVARHERPLHPRGEPGAAATAQAGVLHQLDQVGLAHGERLLQPVVPAALDVAVQTHGLGLVPVTGEAGLEVRAHAAPSGSATEVSRPASTREACRKLCIVGPREGSGVSPRADRGDQLAHALGAHRIEVREVDLDRRREVAHAEAFLLVHGEQAVVGDLAAVRDAGRLVRRLVDVLAAPQHAGEVGADVDEVFARRAAAGTSSRRWRRPRPRRW